MRKVISKSRAIKIVTLIFALIGILAIFPVRVFTQTLETSGGGTIVGETEGINFVGNAEGRDILSGDYDVIVCDGFVGNVLMKFMEGTAGFLFGMIKDELMSSTRTKIGAALAKPAFKNLKKNLDYTEYGGALLLGTKAGLIKAHGSSNAKAIKNTIRQARELVENRTVEKITEELSKLGDTKAEEE